MGNRSAFWGLLLAAAILLLLPGCQNTEAGQPALHAVVSIEADPNALQNVCADLPEGMTRETVSTVQHDFIQDGKQVGGIVILDIPKDLLDAPRLGALGIAECIRQQLMQDIPAEDAEILSWGGCPNAYMELAMGPEKIDSFHYLFRGTAYTYDVWFDWDLLEQDSDTIYEIVQSVTGEDILPENNQNPF